MINRSSSAKLSAPSDLGSTSTAQAGQFSLPETASRNKNAFAGSHLGVPAGPLEAVASTDPRDYVWGVPQAQPGLYANLPHSYPMPGGPLHAQLSAAASGTVPGNLPGSAAPEDHGNLTGMPQCSP